MIKMNHPTICHSIRSKLVLKDSALAISAVNPEPTGDIHVQSCLTDNTVAATTSKWITETTGTQYTSIPTRNVNKRWEIDTNTLGLVVTVQLTLVDNNNDQVTETLTTNGTTAVVTTGATYKACNDMVITSTSILSGGQLIWARAQGGTQNDIRIVLSPTYKLNPIFTCANLNGVTRQAVLSVPQVYTGTLSDIKLTVWNNGAATSTTKLNFMGVPVGSKTLNGNSLVLNAGEWCLWRRVTATSVNTTCSLNAKWTYVNAT